MNRPIKFRAIVHLDTGDIFLDNDVAVYGGGNMIGYDSDDFEKLLPAKHYIDWDGGCIQHSDEDKDIFDNVCPILQDEDWIFVEDPHFTLLQYTGLKDKNGKEIYEGDIVEIDDVLWSVYFASGTAQFRYKSIPYDNDFMDISESDGCKIIGNIYQNPELIKKT